MLKEHGKSLIPFHKYMSLAAPATCDVDDSAINQIGLVSESKNDAVYAVQTSPNHYRLLPGPEFSPRLYRGQNEFHEPCIPSLYRGNRPIDILFWQAKWLELNMALNEHATCIWLRDFKIEDLSFGFNIQGIAQHYGFSTSILDFSRSKDIAMFFAVCAFDSDANTYRPLKTGKAILYAIDLHRMIADGTSRISALSLGMDALPRPAAQKAFGIEMLPREDLNEKPWAERTILEITERESNRYYEMFEGGRVLFPENPFDAYIESIRNNNTLPKPIVEMGLKCRWLPLHPLGVDAAFHDFQIAGYNLVDELDAVPPHIVTAASRDWDERKAQFLSRIRVRGASDHFSC